MLFSMNFTFIERKVHTMLDKSAQVVINIQGGFKRKQEK